MLLHLKEEGVAITIDEPAQDPLRVAARLAFLPEILTGAAPVVHVAGLHGMLERVLVHPGHHENASAGFGTLLHNRGNQAAVIEFEIQVHLLISERRRFRGKKILDRRFSVAECPHFQEDQSVVIASSTHSAPCHRFFEEAPDMISVPLSELMAKLPSQFRKETSAEELSGRKVNLPCRDLLAGNTPRLSLGQLNDLLPDLVVVPEGGDRSEQLNLPAGWVALYYRLVTRFEEVPTECRESRSGKASAVTLPSVDGPAEKSPVTVIEAEMISTNQPEVLSTLESYGAKFHGEKEAQELVPAVSAKRGFFASLPIFRRNVTAKPAPEKQSRVVFPSDIGEKPEALALEPLWKLDPLDQLAEPAALQALFMTEEKLTMDRVIAMAGQLPGLRACILAHGDQVVCASNTPPGIDLQTLSSQAMTMLAQIRESSSKMGLGNVPGVTLHAEQGALSFLHNNELCLLVLHADRGFLPGVRERLQEMLGHLAHAEALPSSPSAQPSLPI